MDQGVEQMRKVTEEMNGTLDQRRLLDDLIQYKQGELNRLQHEVVVTSAEMSRTKQAIDEVKREAKSDALIERNRVLASLEQEKEAVHFERRQLESLDLELNGRQKAMELLEAQGQPIREALTKLQDERLAIEHQRIRNDDLSRENDRLANENSTRHEEVNQLKKGLLTRQVELQRQAVDQEATQTRLEIETKRVTLQIENLSALKKTMDPKLAEVKRLSEQSEKDVHQAVILRDAAAAQQAELDKQRADLAILSRQLQAKSEALTEYDAILKRTEAELRIKIQQAKVEKVEVELPARPSVTQPKA